MKYTDNLRLSIFKNQIESEKLEYLKELTDEELIHLLDSSVIANAVDSNATRYSVLFFLIFSDNQDKKDRFTKQIQRIFALEKRLTKIEKLVIKFGVVKNFTTSNYRKELYRYTQIPLSLKTNSSGRKFISSYKFKEIFYFAYNLIKRGKKNDRLPKI